MKCTVIFKGTEGELDKVRDRPVTVRISPDVYYIPADTEYKQVEPTYRYYTIKELVNLYGDDVDVAKESGYVYVNKYALRICQLGQVCIDPFDSYNEHDKLFKTKADKSI